MEAASKKRKQRSSQILESWREHHLVNVDSKQDVSDLVWVSDVEKNW